jgi:L-amino acid N-acyltransferase YncA
MTERSDPPPQPRPARFDDVTIRPAQDADVPALHAIYAHHVQTTVATFEEVAPTVEEMARRLRMVQSAGLPYLVAQLEGRVAGYAYASPFRARSAYRFMIEDSIYVEPGIVGRGVGRAVLTALIDRCTMLGYRQMVAVTGITGENNRSTQLHEKLGFERVARLRSVGFKHNRWVDIVMLQRALGDGDDTLPPPPEGFEHDLIPMPKPTWARR